MSDNLNPKIDSYEFKDFSSVVADDSDTIQEYQLEEFGEDFKRKDNHGQIIRYERTNANEASFKISPIVKKHRGISKQEREDQEKRINDLVEKKFSMVEEEAYRLGYEKGLETGKQEIYEQLKAEVDEKVDILMEMINEVLAIKTELMQEQRFEIYDLLKSLTKWMTLKELTQDDDYIERLLLKLIQEIETKDNLLIQVNKNHFDKMPKVLERVEERLGELTNVRVEVDYDISEQGIIIESENGIINGSLDQQFKSLDKLFESVGVKADE